MLISTCMLAIAMTGTDVPVKHIGAPASDLDAGWLREPDPREHGTRSHHGVLDSTFVDESVTLQLHVPGHGPLRLLPLGIDAEQWTITATAPDGTIHAGRDDESTLQRGSLLPYGGQVGQRLDIHDATPGLWTATISGGRPGDDIALYIEDGSPQRLRLWLDDYANHAGNEIRVQIGCSTQLSPDSNGVLAMNNAIVRGESIASASADLVHEDGTRTPLPVRDGSIVFRPDHAGVFTVAVDAILSDGRGGLLHRSATLPVAVADDRPVFTATANIEPLDDHRIGVVLPLSIRSDRDRVLAGAEVWATSHDGHRPRCWIGGMTPIDETSLQLVLDTRWLHGCDGDTVELRSVRIADVNTFVPLDRLTSVALASIDIPTTAPTAADRSAMQMGAMRNGRTIRVDLSNATPPARRSAQYGGHNLMLVHGYCEDGDAWELNDFNGDFTEYLNLEQNFTHDQFALDIWSFGSQYKSYSIVGHSQGGNAGLHLYSFYWSGIDWSTGDRKVQAVGTPFLGTPLAGSIADLGEVFGIQCGANYDMTYDGAAQWTSFIPGWSRSETWVWSTTFEDGWFYDYCNLFSDFLLSDPEDGVVEVSQAHLDGTNDMGTKEGWCHIENMADPAQTYDPTRNAEMNSEGAR